MLFRTTSFATCSLLAAFYVAACSPASSSDPNEGEVELEGGDGDSVIDPGTGVDLPSGQAWPGPETPVFSDGATEADVAVFQAAATAQGCVTEPSDGTMIPNNWLRPRFTVAGGAEKYQVTLSSDVMEKDLVGYGGPEGWKLPLEYWQGIAAKATSAVVSVTATVRASTQGVVSENVSTFHIAPASAGGAMIYWASNRSKDHVDSSRLMGFRVGDEDVAETLNATQVTESDLRSYDNYALKSNAGGEWSDATGAQPGKPSCIGCHTSTPDGASVAFNDGFPWSGITATVDPELGAVGQRAPGVTDLGARLLATPFIGTIAFSKGWWSDGSRRAVASFTTLTPYGNMIANLSESADLVWIDLEAPGSADFSQDPTGLFTSFRGTGWDVIARTGDTRAAANPAWSEAGDLIAYASTERVAGSHIGGIVASTAPKSPDGIYSGNTEADLYTVPFNDGAGGMATPVAGAAEPGVAEYYPDFSPDGRFLAYNRAGSTSGYIYYRPDGEVNVIPVEGGAPHRLAANDPPACTGEMSPGVINSWPKWGPSTSTAAGATWYWVVFSSGRAYPGQFLVEPDYYTPTSLDTRSSQLYLAGVRVDNASGEITSYPGLYIWNQNPVESNLTPAWDEFKIPAVTIR